MSVYIICIYLIDLLPLSDNKNLIIQFLPLQTNKHIVKIYYPHSKEFNPHCKQTIVFNLEIEDKKPLPILTCHTNVSYLYIFTL